MATDTVAMGAGMAALLAEDMVVGMVEGTALVVPTTRPELRPVAAEVAMGLVHNLAMEARGGDE